MATFRTSAAGGGTSGSGNRTVTITPAVGDLFVVGVVVSGNTNNAPTMTDNNGAGTYALVAVVPKNGSADRVAVFVRNALMVNTTSTVITANTGANTAGELVVVAVSGMLNAGATAIRQFASQSNQAAAGTPAPVFPAACLTENMTIGFVGNGSNPAGLTTAAGWTERQDVGQSTPSTGLECITRDSGFTGTTITWGSTSATAFADIAVELNTHALISATIATSSSVTATLGGDGALAATIPTTSTLTANISGRGTLSATISTSSSVTGDLTTAASGAIEASISTGSSVSATLAGDGVLAATIATGSSVSAALAGDGVLTASIATGSTVSAALAGDGTLIASILTSSTVSGSLAVDGQMSASITTGSGVSATLAGMGPITASIVTGSGVTAALAGDGALSASIATGSAVSGSLHDITPQAGANISCGSTLSASLTNATPQPQPPVPPPVPPKPPVPTYKKKKRTPTVTFSTSKSYGGSSAYLPSEYLEEYIERMARPRSIVVAPAIEPLPLPLPVDWSPPPKPEPRFLSYIDRVDQSHHFEDQSDRRVVTYNFGEEGNTLRTLLLIAVGVGLALFIWSLARADARLGEPASSRSPRRARRRRRRSGAAARGRAR